MPTQATDVRPHRFDLRYPTAPASQVRARRRAREQAGFTLIEMLVTALVVLLIGTAMAKALISTSDFSADQRLRSQADSVAAQDQERLRGLSDQQLGSLSAAPRQVTVGGRLFYVVSAATLAGGGTSSGCVAQGGAYYKISSKVSWSEHGITQPPIIQESQLARPVMGGLLVKVTDQTATPLAGVTISAADPKTGAVAQTVITDGNGCVLFATLPPGTYNVTLSESGYADVNGNSSVTATGTVVLGDITTTNPATIALAHPSTVTASLTTNQSGVLGEADGISWAGKAGDGSGASTSGTGPQVVPAAPITSATTPALFPFNSASTGPPAYTKQYAFWGGRCPSQQPPSPTPVSVAPGIQGITASVQEPILNVGDLSVTIKGNNGNGGGNTQTYTVAPTDVWLTYNGPNGCTDHWKATLAPNPGGSATPPANGNGWLRYGQPYAPSGTLTVCEDYSSNGASGSPPAGWYSGTSLPQGNTFINQPNPVPTINGSPGSACT